MIGGSKPDGEDAETYQTALGLFDVAVPAPSMKAHGVLPRSAKTTRESQPVRAWKSVNPRWYVARGHENALRKGPRENIG